MPKLTERDRFILKEVERGYVVHIHPFTFAFSTASDLFDVRGIQRSLQKLNRNGVIRVDAMSTEYHRAVALTEKGTQLLAEHEALHSGEAPDAP